MHILDFSDDLGATLSEALRGGPIPELLKTAAWQEPYEALDRDFALILVDDEGEHRKYACHDQGNTSVSMFYLAQAQAHLSPAAVKTAAANLARIGSEQGLAIPEAIQKLASIDEYPQRDIIDERRVVYRPVIAALPSSTKLAGFRLLEAVKHKWGGLEPHEKRAAALALQEEATEVPLEIPREIHSYSGTQLSSKFASHMRQRIGHTGSEELQGEYLRLVKVASVLGADETLRVLYELDKAAGLYWSGGDRYGARLPDPYLCVYQTEKEAMWAWSHGADTVNQAQLLAFAAKPESSRVFTLTFSDGLWLRFVDSPLSVFKAMPLEQQILLSRMARQV